MNKNQKSLRLRGLFACSKPWYMKWWVWLLFLIFILAIPIVINKAYKYGDFTGKGYYTLWEAKDVLAFYGSFLSFIGTVVLGALALHQNKVFKEENQKLLQAQIFSSCAFYKVGSCKVIVDKDDNTFKIVIYLRNIGKSLAVCTMPYEFELSKYGYKCEKQSKDVIIQASDISHSNVLCNGIIDFLSEPVSLKVLENVKTIYIHLTLCIVSENQMQYDQVIRMKFENQNGELKYISEYPAKLLKLYE